MEAKFGEEWVKQMFQRYTEQNIVDVAFGEADAEGEQLASVRAANRRRVAAWMRSDSFRRLRRVRAFALFRPFSAAFDVRRLGWIDH